MRQVKNILSVKKKVGLVGTSPALEQILRTIEQVAATDISVLIIGESGTGKELVAEAIHEASHESWGLARADETATGSRP
ncbi:MAG: sigma 54-interacting transcriptional regulator, partial [bacterium]